MLKPDFASFLILPAFYSPDMDEAAWQEQIRRMFACSQLTQRFVSGQLSPEDYSDGLADQGWDPNWLADFWEEGETLNG